MLWYLHLVDLDRGGGIFLAVFLRVGKVNESLECEMFVRVKNIYRVCKGNWFVYRLWGKVAGGWQIVWACCLYLYPPFLALF